MLRSRLPKLLQSSLLSDAVHLTAVTGCQHDVLLGSNGYQLCQQRSLMIFDVFSKQRKAERKRKIKEDTEHGCECTSAFVHALNACSRRPESSSHADFDDFRAIRDDQGRIWPASQGLIAEGNATVMPDLELQHPDGAVLHFPGGLNASAVLLSIAFRYGAEEMLDSWRKPWQQQFSARPDVRLLELSFVESIVMTAWPFKQMILRAQLRRQQKETPTDRQVPVESLFHFGEAKPLRKALDMSNTLTGYAVLLDSQGRVRWKGCGMAKPDEVGSLLTSTQQLLAN